MNLPNQLFGPIQADINALAGVVQGGFSLAYSMANLDAQFTNRFKGFAGFTPNNYYNNYQTWSQTSLDTTLGTLQAAGMQGQQLQNEQAVLTGLRTMAQTSDGAMEALQVLGQISEQEVQQLMKLRELMLADLQSKQAFQAATIQQQANGGSRGAAVLSVRRRHRRWPDVPAGMALNGDRTREKRTKCTRTTFRIVRVSMLLLVVATFSFAQAPPFVSTNPSQILTAFQAARGNWVANIAGYANELFGALAVIEFAWSAAVMVLEKADLQSFTAALVRKIMWIGGFYMLLINGPVWIPFIIDSFTQIGQNSSGVMSISPSNVFGQGLDCRGRAFERLQRRGLPDAARGHPLSGVRGHHRGDFLRDDHDPVHGRDGRELHRCRSRIHLPRLWWLPMDSALRRAVHRFGRLERRQDPCHLSAHLGWYKPRQCMGGGSTGGLDIGISRNGRA